MATVRFSNELRGEILGKAAGLFTKREREACQIVLPLHITGDVVYDAILGDYAEKVEALPSSFFASRDDIYVQSIDGVDIAESFDLSGYRPFPAHSDDLDTVANSGSLGRFVRLQNVPELEDLKQAATERAEKVAAVKAEKDEFMGGVRKIIYAHATLNPALRAWPALWDLLPEYTKIKHKEIVERRKPKDVSEAMEGVDLSKMTGKMAAAKLLKNNP